MGKQNSKSSKPTIEQIIAEELANNGGKLDNSSYERADLVQPNTYSNSASATQVKDWKEANPGQEYNAQAASQFESKSQQALFEDTRSKLKENARAKAQEKLQEIKDKQPRNRVEEIMVSEDETALTDVRKLEKERAKLDSETFSSKEKLENSPSIFFRAIGAVVPDDWGIDEKKAKKIEELDQKILAAKTPAINKIIEENQAILDKELAHYRALPKENGLLPNMEIAALEASMLKRKRVIRKAKNLVNGAGAWDAFTDPDALLEIGTLGVMGLVEDAMLTLPAVLKAEKNPENLTDGERVLLEAKAEEDKFAQDTADIDRKYWYGMTEGAMHSVGFMASLGVAGTATKGIKFGSKLATMSAQAGANAALTSGAYRGMANNYNGIVGIDEDTGKVLVRKGLQKKMVSQIMDQKTNAQGKRQELLEKAKNATLSDSDKELLDELDQRLGFKKGPKKTFDEVAAAVHEQYEPMGALRSIQHGYTSALAEAVAEKVIGHYADKVLKAGGSAWYKKAGYKFNEFDRKRLGGRYKEFTDTFNKYTGDQLQSFPGEAIEEYLVSPLHALNDWSTEPLTEWLKPQAHLDLMVQTAMIGTGGRLIGGGFSAIDRFRNPELAKDRKELRKKFSKMGSATSDSDISEYVDLANSQSLADLNAQKTKVEALRTEGKTEEADVLEKKMFRNMISASFTTGTSDDFEKALKKMTNNGNLSPEMVKNAQSALEKFKKVAKVRDTYQHLPNVASLMNLKLSEEEARDNIKTLDGKRDKALIEARQEIEEFAEEIGYDGSIDLDHLFEPGSEEGSEAENNFKEQLFEMQFPAVEFLNELDLARKENRNILTDIKTEFGRQKSNKFQEAITQRQIFAQEFARELKRESGDFTFFERLTEGKERAKKYKENFEFTEARIDDIIENIPDEYKKGLTPYDIQEATLEVKKYARMQEAAEKIKQVQEAAKDAEDNKSDDDKPSPLDKSNNKVNNADSEKGISEEDNDPLKDSLTEATDTLSNIADNDPYHLAENEGLFDDMPNERDFTDEQKAVAGNMVKKAVDNIESVNGKKPTFKEMVTEFTDRFGKEKVDHIFDTLVAGWKQNSFEETNFEQVYNEIFDPLADSLSSVLEELTALTPEAPTQESEVEKEHKEEVEKEQKEASKPITKPNVSTNIMYQSIGGNRTTTPALQLGFSALNYTTKIFNGIKEKVTVFNNQLRKTDTIDYKQLLDPTKFKTGDVIGVTVIPEDKWGEYKVNVGYQPNGDPITKTFAQWVKELQDLNPGVDVTKTQDFIDKIPIVALGEGNKPVAYIHDTDWYNRHNVANPTGEDTPAHGDLDPMHQKLIDDANKNLKELREKVVSGKVNKLKITKKDPNGSYYNIPTDQPLITINEATGESTLAVVKGTVITTKGGVAFQNEKRVLVNSPDQLHAYKPGTTLDIRRVGTGKDGKEYYRAFKVFSRDENNKNGIPSSHLETMKWMYAAHIIVGKAEDKLKETVYKSKLRNTKYDMPLEEAEKMAEKILDITEMNIYTPNGIFDMLSGYGTIHKDARKDKQKNSSERKLWEYTDLLYKDTTVNSDFFLAASLPFMQNAKNMITIDEYGNVNDTKKNYDTYAKDTFTTSIKSFNVGTEDKPVWATVLQPTIQFEVADEQAEKAPSVAKVEKEKREKANEALKENLQAFDLAQNDDLTGDEITEVTEQVEKNFKDTGFDVEELTDGVDFDNVDFDDIDLDDTEFDFDEMVNEITDESRLTNIFKVAQELNQAEENHVISYLYNQLLEAIDKKYEGKVNKHVLRKELKESFDVHIAKDKRAKQEQLAALKPLLKKEPSLRLKKLVYANMMILKKYKSIEDNWDAIMNKTLEHAAKYTDIKEVKEEELDDTFESDEHTDNVKDFTKTSIEESAKKKTSYQLRRFMSGIPDIDKNGELKTKTFGLPSYLSFNDVFNSVAQFMNSDTDIDPNFDTMMAKLEEMAEKQPWVKGLIDKLNNEASEQIKKQFVQIYAKHALTMKFTMYSVDKNGAVLKLYDTNAHEITRLVRDGWKNDFKSKSKLVATKGGYHINKEYAKTLLGRYRQLRDADPISGGQERLEGLRDFMAEFGLEIANEVWDEIQMGAFYGSDGASIPFESHFTVGAGIFKNLGDYLERITQADDTDFEAKEKNHPHADMNTILNNLSRMQAKYATQSMTLTFRDGSKQISGQVPPSYVTDMVSRLKVDAEKGERGIIEKLKSKSITSESTILDLLKNEGGFTSKFKIHHVGIVALKQLGKNVGSFAGITDLNTNDHDLTKLGGFQDLKQGEISKQMFGISMRVANMFLPTMSDKTKMMMLQTGVFNFYKDHKVAYTTNDVGETILSKSTSKILYNKLVLPELKRIINIHAKNAEKRNSGNTNITGYDKAAQIFHHLPELNNVRVNGKRLIELIATDTKYHDIEYVEAQAKEALSKVASDYILQQARKKRESLEGFVSRDSEGDIKDIKFFDKTYLDQSPGLSKDQKFEYATLDYVLNSNLTNADTLSLFAGDIALYSKDKDFTAAEPYLQDDDFYAEYSKKTDINVGKRMALLIAPGNKIDNTSKDKYLQLFLQDQEGISENADYLINSFYPGELTDDVQKLLNAHDSAETSESDKKGIRRELSTKFPKIKDYFDIEATDAQEYTTAKEHLYVMYNAGRISDEDYKNMTAKIEAQLNAEKEGKPIPESALITKEEMGFVFQPVKPVYTGQIEDGVDKNKDVMRTVYIKSSSFPLIPQFTAGTNLDNLRKKMEEIEVSTGKKVRASYQSANKVGSVKNPINPLDTSLSIEQMQLSALTLNREDFKIQQDVPYKSDKTKEDKVSMGTQMFKLLLGNGMMQEKGFVLPPVDAGGESRKMDGKELHGHFTEVFTNLVNIKKNELYNELGLDENGQAEDQNELALKVQELLEREAKDRNYPLQDIKGLELQLITPAIGEPYYDFKVPLWLATNGNRFEALLNSIVTNRVMKHKMPGNSYVVGSEAGMGFREQGEDGKIPGIENSRIIYLNNYNGKELKAANESEANFQKPQVFIPAKFKTSNGELIDFFEDYDKTTGKGKYIYTRPNGTMGLKESMIDSELLSLFTFRTPTSSHVSGSGVEIAGFLPPESGDLMIVPRNFTKQKGLDFDVDKETAYALNHVRNYKTGQISVLAPKHKEAGLAKIKKALKELQNDSSFAQYSKKGNTVKFTDSMLFEKLLNEFKETADDASVDAIWTEEIEAIVFDEDRTLEQKYARLEAEYDRKLLENEFIRIHKAIFANPATSVQNKINAVLSMEFAGGQADYIDSLRNSDATETTEQFSLLSEEHQKKKMSLGAAGKLAIGVYSNFVTFQGLTQQADSVIRLQEKVKGADGEVQLVPIGVSIGNVSVDGSFGKINTQDGARTIAEVFAERQNTATDNEKEQILGRVNVNGTTIAVDSMLTALGFDKDELGNSVSYMLLSQPALVEYVEKLSNSKGVTADYNPLVEDEIMQDLLDKYLGEGYAYSEELGGVIDIENEDMVDFEGELTAQKQVDGIRTNGKDSGLNQIAAVLKFIELDKQAKKLTSFQKLLNVNNLGKSIIESNDMYDKLVQAAEQNDEASISNLNKLIGDFIIFDEGKEPQDVKGYQRLEPNGDGKIVFVKPTTAQGSLIVTGLTMAKQLWGPYFPYDDINFKSVVSEIVANSGIDVDSDYKRIEAHHEIIKEAKKFMYSVTSNGIFNQSASQERSRLFKDTPTNTSLAKYLVTLDSEDPKFKQGLKLVKDNKLINKMSYEVGVEGGISLIKYNNTSNDDFDEDYLYNSFPELIIENKPLPNKNGKPYSTRLLAQEMIAYAYLEGGVQQAIQFIKYVPIEYLDAISTPVKIGGEMKMKTITEMMQFYNPKRNKQVFKAFFKPNDNVSSSQFGKQYMQHHPDKANQYSTADWNKKFITDGKHSLIYKPVDKGDIPPNFIAKKVKTRSKLKADKWDLYERVSDLGFRKIDVLGTHGMSEYQFRNVSGYNAESILTSGKEEKQELVKKDNTGNSVAGRPKDAITGLPFGIDQYHSMDDVLDILEKAEDFKNYPHLKEMLQYIRPLIKSGIKFKLNTGIKTGRYDYVNNVLSINPKQLAEKGREGTARVILHELVHSVTSGELRQYYNNDGVTFKEGVHIPEYVMQLNAVFNEYRRTVGAATIARVKQKVKEKGEITSEEIIHVYPAFNVFEFAAGIMTEPELQKKLNETEYKESGKTFTEKFKEILSKLLATIHPDKTTLGEAALGSMFEFIEQENKKLKSRTILPTELPAEKEFNAMYGFTLGEKYYFSDKGGVVNFGTLVSRNYDTEIGEELYTIKSEGRSIVLKEIDLYKDSAEAAKLYKAQIAEQQRLRRMLDQDKPPKADEMVNESENNDNFTDTDIDNLPDCI